MELRVGVNVVLAGVGVVQVAAVAPSLEVADTDGDRFEVDEADFDLLRPVVSATEAEVLLDSLADRPASFSEERESKRSLRYLDVYDSGTCAEQASVLRAILHDPRNESAELQNKKRFEELVFNELAVALGRTAASIRSHVARSLGDAVAPADLLADRSADLPSIAELPRLDGMRPLGAIWIDDKIGAGEAGIECTLTAVPGPWMVWGRTADDVEPAVGGTDAELLAIHAEHVPSQWPDAAVELRRTGEPVAVHGARLCIADAIAVADSRFADRLASRGGEAPFEGRAVLLNIGGDGHCHVEHACLPDQRTIVVRVTAA